MDEGERGESERLQAIIGELGIMGLTDEQFDRYLELLRPDREWEDADEE